MIKYFYCLLTLSLPFRCDLYSQLLTPEQRQFLKQHALILQEDKADVSINWDELSHIFEDIEILLLGEPNHGSREIFLLRNSLIKYLHEQHGFDVVLLESGMGELINVELHKATMTPQQMTNGLFGGWRTSQFVDLMKYIQTNSLSIAGFDVQRTGGSFRQVLSEECSLAGIEEPNFADLEQRFGDQRRLLRMRYANYDSLRESTLQLIDDYQALAVRLASADLKQQTIRTSMTIRTLINRGAYLQFMLQFTRDKNWSKRFAMRDSLMAANIEWLLQDRYRGRKVIVASHNYHIAKYNEKEEVMGEFLRPQTVRQCYSIGICAGSGTYADNNGNVQMQSPPDTSRLDIKHIIHSLDGSVQFLSTHPINGAGSDWLSEKITINDSFIDLKGSQELILSRHFDGIILINRISASDSHRNSIER